MLKRCRIIVGIAVIVVAAPSLVTAQSVWYPPVSEPTVSIQGMKPNLSGESIVKSYSSVWYLSGRIPVSSQALLRVEAPFVLLGLDQSFFSSEETEFALGNPRIGIEVRTADEPIGFFGEAGIRPPLSSDEDFGTLSYGWLTDYDRIDAFLPDFWNVEIGGGSRLQLIDPVGDGGWAQLHLRLTPSIFLPSDDGPDTELFAKYSAQFWYFWPNASVVAGLSGVALVSESDLDFGERTEHQLTFAGNYNFGTVSPGVFIRVPIAEDLSDAVDFVGGLNLTFNIGQ